jgi:three-Cys-motif partner protein
MQDSAIDEIGPWSEVKLAIIREYGAAYSTILSKQPWAKHIYIDAFSGPGVCLSRTSKEFVAGSPLNALLVKPPFSEYHLIDINGDKVSMLKAIVKASESELLIGQQSIKYYEGDCNRELLDKVFPLIAADNRRRALCILDPYGLHLHWDVIKTAGQSRRVDMFLNFPLMDINRNVLHKDPKTVDPADLDRMNRFWGDSSWREVVYDKNTDLFGMECEEKTSSNSQLSAAFRKRIRDVAGFEQVPEPMPMRNSIGRVVYYLYFASQKAVAMHIVRDIFRKYRNIGLK